MVKTSSTAWSDWNQLEKELFPGRIYCPLSLVSGSLFFQRALLQGDLAGMETAVKDLRACPFVCNPTAHVAPYTSPVLLALWLGHRDEIVNYLLAHEPRQPIRATLLREFAVFCGEAPLASIKRLVDYFGNALVAPSVDLKPPPPLQALHYACFRGDARVLRYLAAHGADWTVPATHRRVTPLHVLRIRNEEQAQALAVCLEDLLPPCEQLDVWLAVDREGTTGLEHLLTVAPPALRNYYLQKWLSLFPKSSPEERGSAD